MAAMSEKAAFLSDWDNHFARDGRLYYQPPAANLPAKPALLPPALKQ